MFLMKSLWPGASMMVMQYLVSNFHREMWRCRAFFLPSVCPAPRHT